MLHVATAVVLAVIETIERDGLLGVARVRGAELVAGLERIAARASLLGAVRGRGLMCAFDVTVGGAPALQAALLERGYLVGANVARDVIRVYPPLVVTAAEIAGFLAALDDCVRA